MAQIFEFPKQTSLSSQEVKDISLLIKQALYTHEKLENIAETIKNDPELSNVPVEIIVNTLKLMLEKD